jgi:hypothetical protein
MWRWLLLAGACAGDASADRDSAPPGCEGLDEAACSSTPGCAPVSGRPPPCEYGATMVYAGCRTGSPGCADVTSCGAPPDDASEVWWFAQLCQPDGWTWVDAGCPICE